MSAKSFGKLKKLICVWCGVKKYGQYVRAYDKKGYVNCWCCWDCYNNFSCAKSKKNDSR